MSFDIEHDVRFPLEDDERVEKFLIGTLLALFSGFLIPLLPLYGYLLNVAEGGMEDATDLPAFAEWESLFVDGIKALVILLIYQLPALLVVILSGVVLFALGVGGGEQLVPVGIAVFVVGLLVSVLVGIVFNYLGIVAVLGFAHEREFGAAFDVDTIRDVALDTDFAIAWLYGLGLAIVLNVLVGIVLFFVQLIALIPIIGWLIAIAGLLLFGPLSAAVAFYSQVVAFRVWGRGYADSRGLEPGIGRTAADRETSAPTATGGVPPTEQTSGTDGAAGSNPGADVEGASNRPAVDEGSPSGEEDGVESGRDRTRGTGGESGVDGDERSGGEDADDSDERSGGEDADDSDERSGGEDADDGDERSGGGDADDGDGESGADGDEGDSRDRTAGSDDERS
jgi:hypothetical protein